MERSVIDLRIDLPSFGEREPDEKAGVRLLSNIDIMERRTQGLGHVPENIRDVAVQTLVAMREVSGRELPRSMMFESGRMGGDYESCCWLAYRASCRALGDLCSGRDPMPYLEDAVCHLSGILDELGLAEVMRLPDTYADPWSGHVRIPEGRGRGVR